MSKSMYNFVLYCIKLLLIDPLTLGTVAYTQGSLDNKSVLLLVASSNCVLT